ncbi:MAG: DNA repair protein RadC [Gemmatimonadetes bacterium]|nr:DNA repair protein RadC [Gemmatimonadota bacterium]
MPTLLADHDRPRERLWRLGPAALNARELLAILLGTGSGEHDALATAEQLLHAADGGLRRLAARPGAELMQTAGVGEAKAARLLAAFELAGRLAREARPAAPRIREPADVARFVGDRLRDLPVEEFHLLALDTRSRVLRDVLVTRGLLDSSLVHPREVFRAAIAEAAAGIILVHNHPSGDPTPSPEDRAVTRQLVAAGQLLDLPVYDHVIIAGDRFTSFATAGLLEDDDEVVAGGGPARPRAPAARLADGWSPGQRLTACVNDPDSAAPPPGARRWGAGRAGSVSSSPLLRRTCRLRRPRHAV